MRATVKVVGFGLTFLCVILGVLVLWLQARGERGTDLIGWASADGRVGLSGTSTLNRIQVIWGSSEPPVFVWMRGWSHEFVPRGGGQGWFWRLNQPQMDLRLHYISYQEKFEDHTFYHVLIVNDALLVAVAWLLPALVSASLLRRLFVRLQRRYRYNPGLCSACGYDLRASGNRCPECGKLNDVKISGARTL